MPKRSIPSVPPSAKPHGRHLFDSAIKENLEVILGQRVNPIEQLVNTSTTDDIIAKVNEIIARLQE